MFLATSVNAVSLATTTVNLAASAFAMSFTTSDHFD
jgi:hypothetical protein